MPELAFDRWNWLNYCEKLFQAEAQNLLGLLNGTNPKASNLEPWNPWCIAAWLCNDMEVQYLLITTTPALIWNHVTISTAHTMFQYLKNLFKESTLAMTTVHDVRSINHAQVAAYYATRTPDNCMHMQCAANENVQHKWSQQRVRKTMGELTEEWDTLREKHQEDR